VSEPEDVEDASWGVQQAAGGRDQSVGRLGRTVAGTGHEGQLLEAGRPDGQVGPQRSQWRHRAADRLVGADHRPGTAHAGAAVHVDEAGRSPSWEAAKTTGLVRMFQPELVNRLADVYSMQEEGPMRSLERIAGLLFDRASQYEAQVEQTLVLLEIHLGELIGQEHLLLASYDHVLANFDSSAE